MEQQKISGLPELLSSVNKEDDFIINTVEGTKRVKAPLLIKSIMNLFATGGGAGLHNSIFMGRNLGDHVTEEQKKQIHNRTFDDLWIGDYWHIGDIRYRIAHFDYWMNCGDTPTTAPHVVIVPDSSIDIRQMNATDTIEGGYLGSEMRTANLETAKSEIIAAFGEGLLTVRRHFVNAVTNGKPSAGTWADSTVDLMDECMVYGSRIFTLANDGLTIPSLHTVDYKQLALFALAPQFICNREWYWLSNVVSTAYFARVSDNGSASHSPASSVGDVRPAFAISY